MVRKTLIVPARRWKSAAAGVLAALCLFIALPGQASAKNPTLTIAVGNPEFSADQINPGQSTTANFQVTPFAGTADPEGKTPKINSESFQVTVDNQTTIGAISVSAPGAVVNLETSTPTSVSFDITGTVPTATFTTSIVVQSSQNAATGPHPVTLAGISIDTSDGDGSGNSATEDFQIEKFAVDISGPPYVIIDNNPMDIQLPYYPNGLPPDSTYTARATGGSGNYTWNWSVSSNILLDNGQGGTISHPTDNPISVFGVGPVGPGTITCAATDTVTGSTQNGYRHPDVHDEYVTDWTSEWLEPSDQNPPYGGTGAGDWYQSAPKEPYTITVGSSASVTWTYGGSVSGPIPIADFGLGASFDASYSTESGSGSEGPITCPAQPFATDWQAYLVPMVEEIDGTGYQWGPSGVVNTDALTQKRADSCLADAWSSSGLFAVIPVRVAVSPVAPWW